MPGGRSRERVVTCIITPVKGGMGGYVDNGKIMIYTEVTARTGAEMSCSYSRHYYREIGGLYLP